MYEGMQVQAFGCDFLLTSAYKWFGPHISLMYGREALLQPGPDGLHAKYVPSVQPDPKYMRLSQKI